MFYGIGKDDKKGFRLSDENFRNKINRISYIVKNELAQSRFSTYNAKVFNLGINLTYKYTVTNKGIKVLKKIFDKRGLIKIEIPN